MTSASNAQQDSRETVERLVDDYGVLRYQAGFHQTGFQEQEVVNARAALLAHFQQLEADLTHEHLRRDAAEGECIDCQVALKELEDRLAGAERDAERYLWLRDGIYRYDVEIGEAVITFKVTGSCPTQTEFDSAIDAALAAALAKENP